MPFNYCDFLLKVSIIKNNHKVIIQKAHIKSRISMPQSCVS